MALARLLWFFPIGVSLIIQTVVCHHHDRAAMLMLQVQISPYGWDPKIDYCSWPGVFCNATRFVEMLEVRTQGLKGNISAVSQLKSLKWLDFTMNNFHGPIPHTLDNLAELQFLDLSGNRFEGCIPPQLGNLNNLVTLNLSDNLLACKIPEEFGRLEKLQDLQLSGNRIIGVIPDDIGSLTNLKVFTAHENSLTGNIPGNLGLFSKLEALNLHTNQLVGPIPSSIFASGSLQVLVLTKNNLVGSLPSSIGSCRNLSNIRIGYNRLNGSLPKEIGNISSLTYFEANNNYLSGEIITEISQCLNLTLLNLACNRFSGHLPEELGRLSTLQELIVSSNSLSGEVPRSLIRCRNLNKLDLYKNHLSSQIPNFLCNISRLQYLVLGENLINGEIPQEIGHCARLLELHLGCNNLSGIIPSVIGSLRNLQIALNLSFNHLHGPLPRELGKLDKLVLLDVSSNMLSGIIPPDLKGMISLIQLNFSNNMLRGPVPSFQPFQNSPSSSFSGNEGLCGGPLSSSCHNSFGYKHYFKNAHTVIIVFVFFAFGVSVAVVVVLFILALKEKKERASKAPSTLAKNILNPPLVTASGIFVENIRQAIDFNACIMALRDSNRISSSGFSCVYEVVMPSGLFVMVRHLKCIDRTLKHHQSKMIREIELLAKISHNNVMEPIGFVIYEEVALLLHRYMPHGTLSLFLHGPIARHLDANWSRRFDIAIGVAEGLSFLHHGNIIHLNLSSNNIFLDANFNPLVGEIEIAKLLNPSKGISSISEVTGSLGYIPPEYVYTMEVTAPGNVYSYGVILLEILTTQLPVDEAFGDGMDLVRWVKSASLRGHTPEQVLDSRISTVSFTWRKQMLAALEIALVCTEPAPSKRPNMKKVLQMLHEVTKY